MTIFFKRPFIFAAISLVCAGAVSNSAFAKGIDYDAQITTQLAEMDKYSHYSSSNPDDDKVGAASDKLSGLILKFAHNADFFAAPLKKAQAKGLTAAKSTDGKLRVFSWDSQTGGTAHYFNTILAFKGSSGKLLAMSKPQGEDGDLGAYYTTINSIGTTSGGMLYVLVGDTIGSNIDQGTNLTAYTINNDKLVQTKAFKFKNKMFSSIDCWTEGADGDERSIKFLDQNKTVKIPLTDANRKCTGKYLIYKFDGTNYVFSGNGK